MRKTFLGSTGCAAGMFLILFILVSCATTPALKVKYRLPPESDVLQKKRVSLAFEDIRKNKDILGEEAKREYKYFIGDISLYLSENNEKEVPVGLFDIRSLFMEAFERRLVNLGFTVAPVKGEGDIELVIGLKEFFLELVEKNWVARMSYEARIEKSGKTVASQTISGEAERLKIYGHEQAEIVMGDIFTDVVNRLDVGRLISLADNRN